MPGGSEDKSQTDRDRQRPWVRQRVRACERQSLGKGGLEVNLSPRWERKGLFRDLMGTRGRALPPHGKCCCSPDPRPDISFDFHKMGGFGEAGF